MPAGIASLPAIVNNPRLGAQKLRSPGSPSGALNGDPDGGGGCSRRQISGSAAAGTGADMAERATAAATAASVDVAHLITVGVRVPLVSTGLRLVALAAAGARRPEVEQRRLHGGENRVEGDAGERLLLDQGVGGLVQSAPVGLQDRF